MGRGLLLTTAVLDKNAVTPKRKEKETSHLLSSLPTIVSKKIQRGGENKRRINSTEASISKPVVLSAPI